MSSKLMSSDLIDSDGLTKPNNIGLFVPYGGIRIPAVKHFFQFRRYYRTTYPKKTYPGDLSFNIFLHKLHEKYNKLGDSIYISSVYHNLDKEVVPEVDWRTYYGFNNPGTIANPRGGRVLKVIFFDRLRKMWNNFTTKSLTDFEFNEFLSKKFASDQYFLLYYYLLGIDRAWNKFKLRFPNANRNDYQFKITAGTQPHTIFPEIKNKNNEVRRRRCKEEIMC